MGAVKKKKQKNPPMSGAHADSLSQNLCGWDPGVRMNAQFLPVAEGTGARNHFQVSAAPW